MILNGERMLVAVSGGLDSTVLLDVLHRLSEELSFDIVVGHVDHGLRGAASAQDAAFVQGLAESHELTSVQHRLTESELDQQRSHGREGAARRARLDALRTLAAKAGATRIALGHTLDDHAETIIYRLARGAGPTGMMGIPPVRMPFIRPLLRTPRSDVHAYAVERKLTWREDASNSDLSYARNRIRHRILPELQLLNPRIVEALGRNALLLANLDEVVAFFVEEWMTHLRIELDNSDLSLCRSELVTLPVAVLRLMLREGVRQARGDLNGIELTHIEAIRRLVTSRRAHGELSLPDLHVRMQGDALTISPSSHSAAVPSIVAVDLGENSAFEQQFDIGTRDPPDGGCGHGVSAIGLLDRGRRCRSCRSPAPFENTPDRRSLCAVGIGPGNQAQGFLNQRASAVFRSRQHSPAL